MTNQTEYDALLIQLQKLVDEHILPEYKWYRDKGNWPRYAFRTSGFIVIIGSLLLPVITVSTTLKFKFEILTGLSLTIAILSSLSAFFRWDSMWQSRMKTRMELEALLAQWKFALVSAQEAEDPQHGALAATQTLFEKAFASINSETDQFFSTVKWPSIPKSTQD
jgi:hypothetical protein